MLRWSSVSNASMRCNSSKQEQTMGVILTQARLGLFGAVAQHRLPCPSDADPGANDYSDEQAEYLAAIEEAETQLSMARQLVEAGHFQQARDRMNAAIGWLTEEQA